MSERKLLNLTADQRVNMGALLDAHPEKLRKKAMGLAEDGGVLQLWWVKPGKTLAAEVREEPAAMVTLEFHKSSGFAEIHCDCVSSSLCVHVPAVCSGAQQPRFAQGIPVGSPYDSPSDGKPEGNPISLPSFLRVQNNRALSDREARLAEAIEAFWRIGSPTTSVAYLLQIGGITQYFAGGHNEQVMLWPSDRPPTNAVDAFRYIAHALRERNKLSGLRMFQTIDWAAVDALVAPWQRAREVEKWRRELDRLGHHLEAPPEAIQFRLRLCEGGAQIEWKQPGVEKFSPPTGSVLTQLVHAAGHHQQLPQYPLDAAAKRFLKAMEWDYTVRPMLEAGSHSFRVVLDRLLRQPGFEEVLVSPEGPPLLREPVPLHWELKEPAAGAGDSDDSGDYELVLRTAEGGEIAPAAAVLPGWPDLYVTPERVYEVQLVSEAQTHQAPRVRVPAAAIESPEGIAALKTMQIPVPERLQARHRTVPAVVTVRCRLYTPPGDSIEWFQVSAEATTAEGTSIQFWKGPADGWGRAADVPPSSSSQSPARDAPIISVDRSAQHAATPWLNAAGTEVVSRGGDGRLWSSRQLRGVALRGFPDAFTTWMSCRPPEVTVELDPILASLRDGAVSGTLKLDVEESTIDWFDLRVSLDLTDVELTPTEIDALLKAQGRWVRLPDKGWRRLDFQISDDERMHLADLGLGAADLQGGERHRLHVFQLANPAASRLLPPDRIQSVHRRAEELRTAVTPEVPASVRATLRPYQREGFHFLAYLSTNRFGGILADDMGLGKTIQTLAWLAWLRESGQLDGPTLVVCPKSVQANWQVETARFCPDLEVLLWSGQTAGGFESPEPVPPMRRRPPSGDTATHTLLVINYSQLRLYESTLGQKRWGAVILDEAQYIKNPTSFTAQAAFGLQATHRLALSGTPIENRLLDLWSIMQFAMPCMLGNRSSFTRQFNGKEDPLARRRLAARVRPFVLRRTKKQVAQDLPDRIEEEIICDLEGPQEVLYRAELKRARTMLLRAKTSTQLDKLRFSILTSLLRLRQICCHPSLVGAGTPEDEATKLTALFDLLESLVEEGHKVLVFSQFVDVLELIRTRLLQKKWPHLVLTGQTEDRGSLVSSFQNAEGACIFLISLKAGGFGLNLTAASYVVLFDPWWNPAVENQAIDRTHRIGQSNKVIAYRLLVRDTIEDKIRQLQKSKGELATDILGEESFAKAMTLDDFRFLLGDLVSAEPTPEPGTQARLG